MERKKGKKGEKPSDFFWFENRVRVTFVPEAKK
jgi:hypothetical protein